MIQDVLQQFLISLTEIFYRNFSYALDKIITYHFHGDLVCWVVLFTPTICLSCHVYGSGEHRSIQSDGAQALLWHHDPWRIADDHFWYMVVAGLWFFRGVAAYQAGTGRVIGCLPPLLRKVADRFQKQSQPARPRVLPLVQRIAGAGIICDRHTGRGQALLIEQSAENDSVIHDCLAREQRIGIAEFA